MRRGLKALNGQDDPSSLRGIVQQLLKIPFITEDDFLLENMPIFDPVFRMGSASGTVLKTDIKFFRYLWFGNRCEIFFKADIIVAVAGADIRMTVPANPISSVGNSQRGALYLVHSGTEETGGMGFINDGMAFLRRPANANFAVGTHVVGGNFSYICEKRQN